MKRKLFCLLLLVTLLLSAGLFGTSTAYADGATYEVNFMLDEDTVYQTVSVEENGYLTVPETPVKNGSVFLCWQTQNGDKFSFRTRVTEDLNLYASWQSHTEFFTVTFVVDGEVVSVQEVEKGASAIEPSSVICPDGKVFLRWDKSTEAVTENLIVNAELGDVYYTVRVYADNELISAGRVKHGEDATFINNIVPPEKEHYQINGYIGETERIVKDGNVYVDYQPVSYQVSYMIDSQNYFSAQASYGDVAPMPVSFPVKEGYLFAGWYLDDTLYNFNTSVSGDITLTARFTAIEKPKYTVTFYDYNGNQYGGVQVVEEGQSAIRPGHPIRVGYEFVGWNESFDCVTKDLEIYPRYSANSYDVTVKDYLGVIATFEVSYGQSITVDTTLVRDKEGYEFIGFDESLKNITRDMEINAKYRAKTFVVKFYSDNLQAIGGVQSVEYGKSAKPPKAEKDGYNFIGWKNMDSAVMNDYDVITAHSNFVAVYEKVKYTVTYVENGIPVHVAEVEHGKRASMHSYVKDGYVFGGWFVDESLEIAYNFNNELNANLTLYAKWTECVVETFNVTFYVDGEIYNQQIIAYNGELIMPTYPEKVGYTFRGWDVEGFGFYHAHETISFFNEDMVINAEFDKITCFVKFIWGGNNSGIKYGETIGVEYGQDVVFPPYELNEEGYIFVRWDKDITSVTSDMTVNAIYKKEVYTVTFIDEDENELSVQQVEYKDFAEIVGTPKKEGYTFDHWQNLTDWRAYTFDYEIKKDTVVQAKFKVNTYKLTYYIDGEMYRTFDISYDQVINALTPPSYNTDVKIFLGWSEIPERMPANNVNVYGETYVYQTYNFTLYIDGEIYKNYEVREGKNTPTNLPTPKDLPETIIFKSWGEAPSIMPKNDVRVDAVIEKLSYYKLYYYVEDSIFTVETVLQGKHIYNPSKYEDEVSAMFDETKVFMRWVYDGNDYMPASDLIIHAEIEYKNYYKLSYYINDVLYKSFNLLNGTTIENTEYELGAPTGLPENMEFRGWSRIPDWMPKEDVRVDAYINILEEHVLTYIVDGEVYAQFNVIEGAPLPSVENPVFDNTKWFVEWSNYTDKMPGYNLNLYASLIYLNDIQTESWDGTDETPKYYYSIKISGIVNFVAVKINVESRYANDVILDERYASYSFDTHILVYASGEVITEETTIATFVGDTRLNYNAFRGIEIYTINDAGEIVKTVCYMNGNKN